MSTKTSKNKKIAIQVERLKSFNQDHDHYEEKKVGDEWWIKNYNSGTDRWQVSIYSNDSYRNYKNYNRNKKEMFDIPPSF